MVMWVCEAWQVNIWTVFAVRPNGANKIEGVILELCGGYTVTLPLLGPTKTKQYLELNFFLAEPFVFGNWTETKECGKSCFLKMERHCEPVVLPGLTPPSCNEQNTTMSGKTPCSPCEGDDF